MRIPQCLSLLLLTVCRMPAAADEGFVTEMTVATGAVYASQEHPQVALEEELLLYHGLVYDTFGYVDCEARFSFRNTGDQRLVVPVGFPVRMHVPARTNGYSYDPASGSIGTVTAPTVVRFSRGAPFDGTYENAIKSFAISQDDRPVVVDSLLVEVEPGADGSSARQVHFLHQLDFPAGATSTVIVRYHVLAQTYDSGGPDARKGFGWHYVLGTGATWRGPIGRLWVACPLSLDLDLPTAFEPVGVVTGHRVYVAEDYEPAADDEAVIDHSLYEWPEFSTPWVTEVYPPSVPASPDVTVVGASSSLPDVTWVNAFYTGDPRRIDPSRRETWTVDMQVHIEGIGFGPLSLFDGLPGSAWCEGVPGDGIGEWVEFQLARDCSGLRVSNGFSKSPDLFLSEPAPAVRAAFSNNGRPRRLEISTTDGQTVADLQLGDMAETQTFTVNLPRGTYRVTIRDVYRGARWRDTCLGELSFGEPDAKALVTGRPLLAPLLIAGQARIW